MKKAVLKGYVAVLCVGILICAITSALIFDAKITGITENDMKVLATSLEEGFERAVQQQQDRQAPLDQDFYETLAMDLSRSAEGHRVTLISPEGEVVGDSEIDSTTMENHGDRAEIREAGYDRVGTMIRESDTLGYKMIYAAIQTENGYYLRVAGEYQGLISDLISFLPAIFGSVCVALLAAVVLANRFAKSVSRPIVDLSQSLVDVKDGSAVLKPETYPYDELQDMAQCINRLSENVRANIGRLHEERDKISYILDNMNEGFVLLDQGETVLIINHSACQFFGCEKNVIGRSFLRATRDMDFISSVEKAMKTGKVVTFDCHSEGRILEANIYLVGKEEEREEGQAKPEKERAPGEQDRGLLQLHEEKSADGGVIIILTDVTDSRNSVKLRREFFSNASHELKTPITSIKGFAEMLSSDIELEPSQKQEFIRRIAMETERMNGLINDIIMISRMESGDIAENLTEVDFASVIKECVDEVQPLCASEDVRISSRLDPCLIRADRKDLYSLASNLISNAVKYNKKRGRVEITLQNKGDRAVLRVFNEGEGIPEEKQARIFERFYRLDQGRSKAVGGTGLGLAIVKHVVERYGGTVALSSSEQEGTVFTVNLPKQKEQEG